MTVLRVDPRTHPEWQKLATGAAGSLFTSPPWITALCSTYGFVPQARIAVSGSGDPLAGTAWVDVYDVRGPRRLALPFCDRADPVVTDAAGWAAVSGEALAGDLTFTMRCLDTSPATADPRLSGVDEAAWHATLLDRPLEELHASFRSQTRRNIGTAARAGVKVVLSTEVDAVRAFHRLHVALRKRKYRLLAQPVALFERIWEQFAPSDGIRTALALVDGEVVAGALYLVWNDTVYYKFGASVAEFLPLRPNDAIHWELIQWAHARGLHALDWGLSALDQPGLCGYKRKWATVEGRIRTLRAGRATGDGPAGVDEVLHTVTSLLTDPAVPDAVTERAGAALYRFFC